MLQTTTELKVVRNYVIALWVADIGHGSLSLSSPTHSGCFGTPATHIYYSDTMSSS